MAGRAELLICITCIPSHFQPISFPWDQHSFSEHRIQARAALFVFQYRWPAERKPSPVKNTTFRGPYFMPRHTVWRIPFICWLRTMRLVHDYVFRINMVYMYISGSGIRIIASNAFLFYTSQCPLFCCDK